MSRSKKKVPGFTDKDRNTYRDKRFANKKVRNTNNIPDGKYYKKLYCSWNIRDWKWLYWNPKEILDFYWKNPYKPYIK